MIVPQPPISFYAGLAYCNREDAPLKLDVLAPQRKVGAAPLPVAVYFHGGGWHEGDRGAGMHPWLNPLLAARGYVTVSVTYRLSTSAQWPAQYEDAHDALGWVLDHITEFGGDPSRVGVWGFSAGAHLAAHLALRAPGTVKAASLAACPTDLRNSRVDEANEVTWLLGRSPGAEALAEVSPICWVESEAPPVLIVHGTNDQIVDFAQGIALRDALESAGAPVEFIEIPSGGHEWADKPSAPGSGPDADFGSVTAQFFDRVL